MGPVYSYMNIIFRENHVNLEQNIKNFKGGLITFASCIFSYYAILICTAVKLMNKTLLKCNCNLMRL